MSDSRSVKSKYRRILLKLSGEILGGGGFGYSEEVIHSIADEIKEAKERFDVDIALVVGGGNIFRGRDASRVGIDETTGDYMGMLATIMNALALQSILEQKGLDTRVMSAIEVRSVAEFYIRRRAIRHLEKGRVVIFAGGTGNPLFSTDTAGTLRAIEIGADVLLKGSKVDGVYDRDPDSSSDARRYEELTYDEYIRKNLQVMDATAITLAREHNLPVIVFDITRRGNLLRLLSGQKVGTLIRP